MAAYRDTLHNDILCYLSHNTPVKTGEISEISELSVIWQKDDLIMCSHIFCLDNEKLWRVSAEASCKIINKVFSNQLLNPLINVRHFPLTVRLSLSERETTSMHQSISIIYKRNIISFVFSQTYGTWPISHVVSWGSAHRLKLIGCCAEPYWADWLEHRVR